MFVARLDFRRFLESGLRSGVSAGSFPEQRLVIEPCSWPGYSEGVNAGSFRVFHHNAKIVIENYQRWYLPVALGLPAGRFSGFHDGKENFCFKIKLATTTKNK